MFLSAGLLALGFAIAPVRGVEVARQPPEEFRRRSEAEPDRLFALIVGATWCKPCHHLVDRLTAVSDSTSTISLAAWDLVEADAFGEKPLADFLSAFNIAVPTAFPTVLVLKKGRFLGYTTVGADIAGIRDFLLDAGQKRPGERAGLPQLLCPRLGDDASFTLGISGFLSDNDSSTDAFGASNLLAFQEGGAPSRLFAPSTGTAAGAFPAPSGTGYLLGENRLTRLAGKIEPVAGSTIALAGLAGRPRGLVRLVLTGHGGPSGMVYAYSDKNLTSIAMPQYLDEPALTSAIRAARASGHAVRGLVLACFGGQFGEAFMPGRRGEAPACAAFSSLPEKAAEGCYRSSDSAARLDYLYKAARFLQCPSPGDGRRRHYQVVLSTGGHDIPMLSSEYFLLFGPGADYLGRGERAPAPSRSIARYRLASDVEIYADLIGGAVVRATKDGRAVPLPREAVVDCEENYMNYRSLDGEHVSASFARSRIVGPNPVKRKDCAPVVSLTWDEEDGDAFPAAEIKLTATNLSDERYRVDLYSPDETMESFRVEPAAAFAREFGPQGPAISLRGLKKEARALIRTVLPALASPLSEDALANLLQSWAAELKPADAPLAEALSAMVEARRRDNARQGRAASESRDATVHLSQAMWKNLAPGEGSSDDVNVARLAHLAATARAELTLRKDAGSSTRAQRLVRELEALQACERGLY